MSIVRTSTACAPSRCWRCSRSTPSRTPMPGGFVGRRRVLRHLRLPDHRDHPRRPRSDGRFTFADFYWRRVRRIFPALVLVLAVSLALGWLVLLPDEYRQLGKHVAAGAGFVSNLALLARGRLLRRRRGAQAAAAPVVARRRGAVLPGLAAAAVPRPQGRWSAARHDRGALAALSFAAQPLAHRRQPVGGVLPAGDALLGAADRQRCSPFRVHQRVLQLWRRFAAIAGVGWLVAGVRPAERRARASPAGGRCCRWLGAALLISAGPAAWINRHVLAHPRRGLRRPDQLSAVPVALAAALLRAHRAGRRAAGRAALGPARREPCCSRP